MATVMDFEEEKSQNLWNWNRQFGPAAFLTIYDLWMNNNDEKNEEQKEESSENEERGEQCGDPTLG